MVFSAERFRVQIYKDILDHRTLGMWLFKLSLIKKLIIIQFVKTLRNSEVPTVFIRAAIYLSFTLIISTRSRNRYFSLVSFIIVVFILFFLDDYCVPDLRFNDSKSRLYLTKIEHHMSLLVTQTSSPPPY